MDWGLRVPPHQRPQSVAAWREVIDGRAEVPSPQAAPARAAPPPPPPAAPAAAALDIEFADTVQGLPEEMLRTTLVPAPAVPNRRPRPLLLAAAGVLSLVLLGLFVVQLRDNMAKHAPPPVATAASAASAAPAPAEPASATPAPASLPAVVDAASAVLPAASASQPKAAPAPAPAARPVPASAPARRDSGALKPIVTEKAGDFRPVPRSPVFAAPEPAASAVATPTQAAPASTAAAPEPRTPGEACGSRVLLARSWCIDRQCEKAQFRNDPECVRLRELRHRPGDAP